MKKLLKNSVFRILITIAGDICLFVFLFTYIIPYKLTSWMTIALTILLFIFFAVVFTMTMICELCYDEASKQLVFEGNLEKAHEWIMRMHAIDFLKWYRSQYAVFMTIYYRDTEEFDQLEQLMGDKIFHSNASMMLVHNYNQFLLAMNHQDDTTVRQYFNLIKETYSENPDKKKDKVALIYSLGMIRAERDMYLRSYKEALSTLNKVEINKLNKREQGYYYYLKYCALVCSNDKRKAQQFLKMAAAQYPQGQFIKPING